MKPDQNAFTEHEQREHIKGSSLEYLYDVHPSIVPVEYPLLGSALRGIGKKDWRVAIVAAGHNHEVFSRFKDTLQDDKLDVYTFADDPNDISSTTYNLILLDGSIPGTHIKQTRDALTGKAHVMVAGSDIAHKEYDLISRFEKKLLMPTGVTAITGDGKGKSTTAYGIAAAETTKGNKAAVVQWIKKREWDVAEHDFSDQLHDPSQLPFYVEGQGFFGYQPLESESNIEKHTQAAQHGIAVAKDLLRSGHYDVLVFDELVDTVASISQNIPEDILTLEKVRDLLEYTQKFPKTKVVVTGRQVTNAWMDLIKDSITITNVRHPYGTGRRAQRGLDF